MMELSRGSKMTARSKSWAEIVQHTENRISADSPMKRLMIDVKDRVNGAADGWILPVGSSQEEEAFDPLVPALVAEAVDNHAMLAGGVGVRVTCPPIDIGKPEGIRSTEYANIREAAIYQTMEDSRFGLGMRRMYRHIAGYATMAAAVMDDTRNKRPHLQVMDPLSAYPTPRAPEDLTDPVDCMFVQGKPVEWLRQRFPHLQKEQGGFLEKTQGWWDQMWNVGWWVDDYEWVYGIIGPRQQWENIQFEAIRGSELTEIYRFQHGLSHAPFIAPNRVTMDKAISQISNVSDMVDIKARLTRLQLAAAEKAVFPDKYVLGDETQAVTINDGANHWKDGRHQGVNVILGARAIGNLPATPDPSAMQLGDRLERDFRISTDLIPQMGGETYGALRTGRANDVMQQMAVNPRVQESQETMEAHLPRLFHSVLEMYEKRFPKRHYTLFPGFSGDDEMVQFTPSTHVEGMYLSRARYAITGAGVEGTNIILSQLVAAELMSRETARQLHPFIRGNHEDARINVEKLREATMQGILQGMISGAIPPVMGAFIAEAQAEAPNRDIFEALRIADERMREWQASQPPPDSPELQPGIAPGAPAGPTPAVPELEPGIAPTSGMEGLRQLNNAIAGGNRSEF